MKVLSSEFKNTTLSHGTMRVKDLIPAFADFLNGNDAWPALEPQDACFSLARTEDGDYINSELADWLLEDLFDALNEIAPDNCYFGSHPGDGSDYGFWEVEDF